MANVKCVVGLSPEFSRQVSVSPISPLQLALLNTLDVILNQGQRLDAGSRDQSTLPLGGDPFRAMIGGE